MTPIMTGRDFGVALAKHFGLPPGQLFEPVTVASGADSVFTVNLNLALTPEDMKGIGAWMAEPDSKREPEGERLAGASCSARMACGFLPMRFGM